MLELESWASGSILTGGNILLLFFFCFHIVKTLKSIMALLPFLCISKKLYYICPYYYYESHLFACPWLQVLSLTLHCTCFPAKFGQNPMTLEESLHLKTLAISISAFYGENCMSNFTHRTDLYKDLTSWRTEKNIVKALRY